MTHVHANMSLQRPLSDLTDDDQTDDENCNEKNSDQNSCVPLSSLFWTQPRRENDTQVSVVKKAKKKRKRKNKKKIKPAKKTKIDRARERARKFPNNIEKLKKFFGTTSEGKLIEQESFKYFWDKKYLNEDEFDADDMDNEVKEEVEKWLQTFLDWRNIPYNHKQVCTFFDCIVTDEKFRSITLQFEGKEGEEYDNYIQWSPFSPFQRRMIKFWNKILHKKGRLVSYSFQSEGETIVEGEIRIMNDDYDAFVRDINTIELMEQKIGKSKVTNIVEQNVINFESYAGYVKKMRAFQCMLQVGDNVKIAKYDDISLSNKFRTQFVTKLKKVVGVNSLQESKGNENTVYKSHEHGGYNIEEYIKEMDERQNNKETRWIVKKIDGDDVTIESNGESDTVHINYLRPFDLDTLQEILNRDKIELTMKRLLQKKDKGGARMIWKHVTDKTPLEIEKEENISYEDPNIKKEKSGGASIYCRYCGARDLKNREFNQVFRKIEYGQKKVWFCNTHGVQLMNYFNHRTETKPKPLQCFSDNCCIPCAPEQNTEFAFIGKKKREKINHHVEKIFLGLKKNEKTNFVLDFELVSNLITKYQ